MNQRVKQMIETESENRKREKDFLFLKKALQVVFCCLVLAATNSMAAENIDTHFRMLYFEKLADRLYDTREIPRNLEAALKYYKKVKKISEGRTEVVWKITRCYWILATRAIAKEERTRYFREGLRYGTMAVNSDNANSNSHLWNALMIGSNALDQGVVISVYLKDRVRSGLESALKLDPENINAIVGLAGWYFYVPALFGGNEEKAIQLLDKSLEMDPNYTMALMTKADFLISRKRYSQAVGALKQLLRIKKPTLRGDGMDNKGRAEELLAELKKKGLGI